MAMRSRCVATKSILANFATPRKLIECAGKLFIDLTLEQLHRSVQTSTNYKVA